MRWKKAELDNVCAILVCGKVMVLEVERDGKSVLGSMYMS